MVTAKSALRGEVWLCELNPTVGSEIRKTRPCLIISPDSMNRHLRTITAMPLTSGSHPAGFRVAVCFKGKDGLLLGDQIHTLDRTRLVKRLGAVDAATLASTLSMLREMFAE